MYILKLLSHKYTKVVKWYADKFPFKNIVLCMCIAIAKIYATSIHEFMMFRTNKLVKNKLIFLC